MMQLLKTKIIILKICFLINLCTASYYTNKDEITVKIKTSIPGEQSILILPSREQPELKKMVATGVFRTTYNTTGWNTLEVWTNSHYDDESQAYWGGYSEGCLTTTVISQHWYNTRSLYCVNKEYVCEKTNEFLKENKRWIEQMIKENRESSDYWLQVHLFYIQLEGLHKGYKKCKKPNDIEISFEELILMNSETELPDIEKSFTVEHEWKRETIPRQLSDDHCSAIIKLLPENKDIYIGHATFDTYNHMIRILKNYIFQFHLVSKVTTLIPGKRITFSGYPGIIHSVDDYYTISSGLAVLHTTISNINPKIWKAIYAKGKVLEHARVMVANRLATSGQSWAEIFSQHNSGTYNNQWMIVDFSKFVPGKPLKPGLLWVLEQLPGIITAEDETKVLKKQTYWASYNIPFYLETFRLSGQTDQIKKFGKWFSYENNTRGQIFKREQSKITNMQNFLALMRYNDYKKDSLSVCNCTPGYSASNAIAARHDLNPANGTYEFHYLAHRAGGALDAKITNSSLFKTQQFIAISGPTTSHNLPPFKWSKSDFNIRYRHEGQPDEWNFKPVLTKWTLN